MGAFRQFTALLWKNYIARKRHPVLFLLELLLPIVIFLTVGFMRRALPPDERYSCSYKERNLPSAGLIPFLQSSICALDNPCVNETAVPEVAARQQMFRSLIADLGPTLDKPSTTNALKALPTVSSVFVVLKNSSDKINITRIEDKLKIRNMVKDPAAIHHILVDTYGVLSSEATEALLDSTLNAVKMIGLSAIDFRGITCDPDQLEKYVYFKKEVDVKMVSESLCRINDNQISPITNDLLKQLDIRNIISLAEEFAGMTGEVDMAQLLKDLGGLVEMFLGSSNLIPDFASLALIEDLPAMLTMMTELVPLMTGVSELDMNSIGLMYEVIKPMLSTLINDTELIKSLDAMFLGNMTDMFSDPANIDWEAMLGQTGPMSEVLQNFMVRTQVIDMPSDDITAILEELMMNGTISNYSALNRSMDYMDRLMEEVLGPDTRNFMMMMGVNIMDMSSNMRTMTDDLQDQIVYQVQNNPDIKEALVKITEIGPEKGQDFLEEVVKVNNIYGLLTNEVDAMAVCENSAFNTLESLSDAEKDGFMSVVCQPEVTNTITAVFRNSSYSHMQEQMVSMMNDIYAVFNGTTPVAQNMTMADMYYRIIDMTENVTVVPMIDEKTWEVILPNTDEFTRYEWMAVWNNVNDNFGISKNLFLLLPALGEAMEKSSMWSTMKVPVTMMYAIVDVLAERFVGLDGMSQKGTVLATGISYMKYFPELSRAFLQNFTQDQLTAPNSGNMTEDILTLWCDHLDWHTLGISPSVPVDDIKTFICTTDWFTFFQDMFELVEPMTMAAEIEKVYMDSDENGVDWGMASKTFQNIVDLFQSDMVSVWINADFNMQDVWAMFEMIGEMLTDLRMTSISGDNLRMSTAALVSLDEMFASEKLWTRIKHYCQTWLFLAKAMNGYVEASQVPGFNITEYISQQSPTLGSHFKDASMSIPDFSEVLMLENMAVILTNLLSTDYNALCNGSSVSSAVVSGSSSLAMLEGRLCEFDLEAINNELRANNPNYDGYISQLEIIMMDTASLPDIMVNWTDLILTTEEYLDHSGRMLFGDLMFDMSGINSGNINMTFDDLMTLASEINGDDLSKLLGNLNGIASAFRDDSSVVSPLMDYMQMNLYVEYHIIRFLNKQLQYFNDSDVVDLKTYMNSSEADKLLNLIVKSPELTPVVFETVKDRMYNIDKVTSLDLDQVCNTSSSTFSELIVRANTTTMTDAEIQDLVCALDLDFGKLIEQLSHSLDGLDDLMHAIENFMSPNATDSDLNVNYTAYTTESELTQQLIEALIVSPPTVLITGISIEDHVEELVSVIDSQLNSFLSDYNNVTWPMILESFGAQGIGSLDQAMSGVKGLGIVTVTSLYAESLYNMIDLAHILMMEPGARSGAYPEMQKVWDLMDWFPEVFATYTYTSENDVEKANLFLQLLTNSTEALCIANPDDLMTVPPKLDFDFTAFFNKFCAIDMAALAQEMEKISDLQEISNAHAGVGSNVSFTEMSANIDALTRSATEFFSSSGSWYIPRFLNMTLWTDILELVLSESMPEANGTVNATKLIQTTLNQQAQQLVSMLDAIPELNAILQVTHTYIRVFERMISIQQGTIFEDDSVLDKYPNVKVVWSLMQDLPHVGQTFMYTMVTDGPKITHFFDSLMKGLDQFCLENPDDLMTVVVNTSFSFNDFFDKFCSIDFDALEEEALNLGSGGPGVMDLFTVWEPSNETVNVTVLFSDMEHLLSGSVDVLSRLGTIQAPAFLDLTVWGNLMEPVLESLMNSSNLDQLPSSVGLFEGIFGNDTSKILATMNIVMEEIIKGLEDTNATKDGITGNVSDVVSLLESLEHLSQLLGNEGENLTIDAEKLNMLLSDPQSIVTMCDNDTLAEFLTVPGASVAVAQTLEEIMCISPVALAKSLQDQINREMVGKKIDAIWNNQVIPDWSTLSSNIEKLTELLMSLVETEDPETINLEEWFNDNSIMDFITSTSTNPQMLLGFLKMLDIDLGYDGNTAMGIASRFIVLLVKNLKEISDDKSLSNPVKLARMLSMVSSADEWLVMLMDAQYRSVMTSAGEIPDLQRLVCDVPIMEYAAIGAGYLSQPISRVSSLLCGLNSSLWYQTLAENNFTDSDMATLQTVFERYSGVQLMEPATWRDIIENLSEASNSVASVEFENFLNSLTEEDLLTTGLENTGESMAMLFQLVIGESIPEFNSLLETVAAFLDILDKQLTDVGRLSLTQFLPDAEKVKEMLQNSLSEENIASMMTAMINPEQFISVLFGGDWNEVVCDADEFNKLFVFPEGTDTVAIQQDLCNSAGEPVSLEELFGEDMSGIMARLTDIMSGTSISNQTLESILAHINKQMIKIIENMNLDPTMMMEEFENWMSPIISYLESPDMALTNTDSMISACDSMLGYVQKTEIYSEMLKPTFDMYLSQMYVATDMIELVIDFHDIACIGDRDIETILKALQESDVPTQLQSLTEQLTGQSSQDGMSCQGMIDAYSSYNSLVESSMVILFNESNSLITCMGELIVKSGDILSDTARLLSVGDQITEILQDDRMKGFVEAIGGTDTTVMFQEVISMFAQQQTAQDSFERLLQTNMSNIFELFQNSFNLGREPVAGFVEQMLGLKLDNMTGEELINKVCNTEDRDAMFGEESLWGGSVDEVLDSLCGPDRNTALEMANYLLELSRVTSGLKNLEAENLLGTLSQDIADLIRDIEGISDLALYVERLSNFDLETLDGSTLSTLQRLLLDKGPDRLLQSLNNLLDNFVTDEDSSDFVEDLKMLSNGLFSFKSLRHIFMTNVQIEDLVKDKEALKQYLIEEVKLPQDVATAVVEGSLSFEMLLEASQTNISEWVCNPVELADLIKGEEETGLNVTYISHQFCSLDAETVTKMMEEILEQLDLGDMFEEMILNGVGSLLSDANTTVEETKTALKDIELASKDLQKVFTQVEEYLENIPNAAEALTSSNTDTLNYEAISQIICGDPIKPIDDQLNLDKFTVKRPELTEGQRKEMEELPGAKCKEMYADIMAENAGPIIWGYLKPLLRGKILYAPDTVQVRSIINEINSTFGSLENVFKVTKDWAQGTVSIKDLLADDGSTEVQEIFNSTLVQNILSSLSGTSSDGLEDMIYQLNDMDSEVVNGLVGVAEWASDYLECVELDRFEGFATEAELEAEASRLHFDRSLLAGIVFTNTPSSREKRQASSSIPSHMEYKIRMNIDNIMQTRRIKERMWRPQPEDQFTTELRYFRGFIQLQDMIDKAIITHQAGTSVVFPSVTTMEFPFPCYSRDTFVNAFGGYGLPITMTISWIVIISVAVNFLVYDREAGQEETLKAMGMKSALNWWAWFVTTMLMMALVDLIVTLILLGMKVFTYSHFGIIYLYILDFLFSTLMLSYFVSAFFTRPAMAILASLIVYILSYLPFVILFTMETDMTFWQKSLACLSSTTAFSFSAVFIARFEETQVGIQWDNIDTSPIHNEDFTFSWGCIMMLIDAAIYLVLGYYVRNVKPGKYGLSQPWYFIFCPWYWCSLGSSKDDNYQPTQQDAYVQNVRYQTPVVMSVRGLVKEFKKGERVVDNLSLTIHGGSVTTLLGHNGAAKTTTMKMLIGQLEPTSGEITICGNPVSKMRESIGVCPQHNSLYEYMTVLEHMKFYSSMKSNTKVLSDEQEIEKLLVDVGLWQNRYQRVTELSGGMQRRLCVALAFVGGSKLVILDEPTSGVDPSGRRAIWNLILRQKNDVAVLLSTHHMDEADVISDQVVIMHNGRLLSQGSPIFLKNNFSAGHRLTVVKDSQYDPDPSKIFERIKSWVSEVRIQHVFGYETQFVLPALGMGMFYDLFTDLEDHKAELNIESYGVSDPTLEEVFLKVCSAADAGAVQVTPETVRDTETEQANTKSLNNGEKSDIEGSVSSYDSLSKMETEKGMSLGFSQLKALLIKRFHHYRRDYRMFITILLLPLILFFAASGFYSIKPDSTEAPSLLLTPSLYGPNTYAFFKMETTKPLPNAILDSFMHSPGIGTSCMAGMDLSDPFKCVAPDQQFTEESLIKINGTCFCDDFKYVCDREPAVNHPRHLRTVTTDILQDLAGKEVDSYLLQSFHSYIEKRYGGWIFTNKNDPSRASSVEAAIWYNNKGHHALPSFYNAYSNGLLRSVVSGDPAQYGITTYNHPFLFDKEQIGEETLLQSFADMGIAFCIVVAFTFIPAGVLMYIVTENASREKQLQMISGVGPALYWLSSLIWDMLLYGIAVGIAVIIMAIFQHDAFWARENTEGIVVLMFLFGFATLSLMYCASRLFKDVATAFFVMFCSLIIVGIVFTLVLMTMEYFVDSSEGIDSATDVLRGIFLLVPTFSFANGLMDIITNQVRTDIFARFNTDVYISPFSVDIAGWNMIALAIEGFVFLILTVLLDIRCRRSRRYRFESPFSEEEDVTREFKRIEQGHSTNDVVLVHNLHKVFKGSQKNVHAVNGLSFGVPAGECFGLLGVNGAGKTTTFNILTGILDSTEGDAVIMGKKKLYGLSHLGYCPQDDALDPFLSVAEMLFFHCKLKGIPRGSRHKTVQTVMERLQLLNIQNKVVKTCSGGMKRKLCLAIALLGDPDVVLLDEPTTGMDPKAKRLVWDYLLSAKNKGMSIILTSHSMEECDIMCDRMGIMVNGRFKCLGSSQHLKEKYGSGYTVKLSFSGLSTTSNMIQELIDNFFPSAQIREYHQSVLQLDLPRDTYRLTDLLHILEKEKERYNILYYTVAQTTLDTIFLNFAREQTDGSPDEDPTSGSTYSLQDNSTVTSYPSIYKANSPQHAFTNDTYESAYDNNRMIGQANLRKDKSKDGPKFNHPVLYDNMAAPEQVYPRLVNLERPSDGGFTGDSTRL